MSSGQAINLSNVSFAYQGQDGPALRNVDLQVREGECVLVTGPSGCGKSTLLRLINGLIPHYFEGTLEGQVQSAEVDPGSVALYEQAALTGSVFQNPRTQFYTTDTTCELAFALENLGTPAEEIVQRVEDVANAMELAALMDRSLFELSGGEKQRIACACVNVVSPGIVLLDEPTANLDYQASQQLASIIAQWKREGKTVLIAEHRLAWVLDVVDTLVVLRDGCVEQVVRGDVVGTISEAFCAEHGLRSARACNPEDVPVARFIPDAALQNDCWQLENLHFAYSQEAPVLDFDRIAFAPGKVTAVVGHNGRGKTTFLRCLAGLEKKDASALYKDGKAWDRKQRLGEVFLVQQDVNCQLFTQSVREEVQISLPEGADEGQIDAILASLDLASVADRDPFTLSGGQKQRVAVACAIASGRPIVSFDEPTSGLGLDHMLLFGQILQSLVAQGRTVVVVTHDTELIEAVADYLLVL